MIICGTDFSEGSRAAARVAGSIAERFASDLELVHVIARPGSDDGVDEAERARLGLEADGLRARFGIEVEPVVAGGAPDEQLVALASRLDARLLVVAALGEQKHRRWLLGSVAERVAQSSPVPVLVVRDGACIESWARGERPLRVMVGVELTPTSKAAFRWAGALRAIGPCELIVVRIAWPAEEHQRAGIPAPMPLDSLRPELERTLVGELASWAGEQPAPGDVSFIVKPGWGRVDRHLTLLAAELDVDLLVVGAHQRSGIARLWQGSVSRGVLHSATMSVACVPLPREPVR